MKKSEKKNPIGGLNSDFNFNSPGFAPDDYVDKLNRRHDESIEGSAGADVNIPSTVELIIPTNIRPQNQVYTVIGYREDRAKNRGFIFYHGAPTVLSDLPCHHVLQLDFATKQYTTVLMNGPQTGGKDVLNFSKDHLILHIDIIEDKLYWTDGYNDPRKINVETAKVTRAYFFAATGSLASKVLTTTGMSAIPAGNYNITVSTPRPRRYTVTSISGGNVNIQEGLLKTANSAPAYLYSGYGLITKELLKNIKTQPAFAPLARYTTNLQLTVNSLGKDLFQFRYRYIYKDNEVSTLSAASLRPQLTNVINGFVYENNGIKVGFNTGGPDVAKIEIVARTGVRDYFSVVVIDKLASPEYADDCACYFDFYNNGIYNSITVEDQLKISDEAIPYTAKTQAILNKNYLGYGNIVQGIDTIDSKLVDADFEVLYTGGKWRNGIQPDIELLCAYHKFYTAGFIVNIVSQLTVLGQYSGLDPQSGIFRLRSKANEAGNTPEYEILPPINNDNGTTYGYIVSQLTTAGYVVDEAESSPGLYTASGIANDISWVTRGLTLLVQNPFSGSNFLSNMTGIYQTYKSGDRNQVGIQYFDTEGRRVGGVVTKPEWVLAFPNFRENTSGQYNPPPANDGSANYGESTAGFRYTIRHRPPVGAVSYAIVRTKNLYKTSYLQWLATAGSIDSGNQNITEIDYSNIFLYQKNNSGQSNVTYDPKDGDRIRLIGKVDYDNTVGHPPMYGIIQAYPEVYDTEILLDYLYQGQTTPVKPYRIRFKKPSFDPQPGANQCIFFEVYTPGTGLADANSIFYEFGPRYPIVTALDGTRSHYANQRYRANGASEDVGIESNGDQYTKIRKITVVNIESGDDGTKPVVLMPCESTFRNDFYDTSYSDNGRAVIVDPYAGRKERPVTLVNSRQNVYQTSINGLSSFDDNQFMDGDIQYGSIQKIHSREGNLEIYQEDRCADMPINQQQQVDNFSDARVVNSVTVLNKIQYNPVSEYSIGTHPESFWASYNSRYFADVKRGKVLRRANDGITPISDYKQATYFGNLCEKFIRTGSQYIFGGGDRNNEKYLIYFNIAGDTEGTRAFAEKYNRWTERYSFAQEFFGNIDNSLITFSGGKTYLHDSPDAVNYNSFHGQPAVNGSITIVFNQAPEDKKTFHALRLKPVLVNTFSAPEIGTSLGQLSELLSSDFKALRMEGISHAGLLRDKNTPNINLPLNYGDHLKGAWIQVKLVCEDNTKKNELYSVELLYISTNI